jgi:hypothetical protein
VCSSDLDIIIRSDTADFQEAVTGIVDYLTERQYIMKTKMRSIAE